MNKKIAELLIKWVWAVTALLTYQANIIPHTQLEDLIERADELTKEIGKEVE
jgi:hypothetical protein